MTNLLDYKEAIRDIRHALAEYQPEQSQKWMNATPKEVSEVIELILMTIKEILPRIGVDEYALEVWDEVICGMCGARLPRQNHTEQCEYIRLKNLNS